MHDPRLPLPRLVRRLVRVAPRALGALGLGLLAASCGGAGGPSGPSEPFVAKFPVDPPHDAPAPTPLPPPTFPKTPVWDPNAVDLKRVAAFGSFPSDVVAFDDTVFTTDADAIESDGVRVLAVDVSGAAPSRSARYATTTVHASDLVDSNGSPGDVAHPVGFGAFANDLLAVRGDLAFLLVSAGGSDSTPALSNVVVFDPTTGRVRQTVDLANAFPALGAVDSAGTPVPGGAFTQSGAEGLAFVPTGATKGRLLVAMSNFVFGAPSFGAVKYPGTVQVFDVDSAAAFPVSPIPSGPLATLAFTTKRFSPVAVTWLVNALGPDRILVTCAGTTALDASFRLRPVTPASVEVYDAPTLAYLGSFDLGLAGLSATRPAIGTDRVGHLVGFVASSVLGEAYLLRLDGLVGPSLDPARIAVLRGPSNGIPVDTASAGLPGGNVSGLALSSAGDVLLLSGFGDLFAFPEPKPGRLLALSLPIDLVGDPFFPSSFVPGTASLVTAPGRTLGGLVVAPGQGGGPEVWAAVGGAIDLGTFLGSGPASLGSLQTFGRIR